MDKLNFLKTFWSKNEHYPISDKFIEEHQQKDDNNAGSYITYAKQTGHIVDAKMHEPNQKWHLLEAYFLGRLIDNNGEFDFIINGFKCPELLLWMAEAVGVENGIIEEASCFAKEKIEQIRKENPEKSYTAEAANYLNKKISEKYDKTLWVMICEKL